MRDSDERFRNLNRLAGPAELAKAQIHATLAVADAISAVAEAIVRTRPQ